MKLKTILKSILLASTACLVACQANLLDPKSYVQWMENPVHGLRNSVIQNGIEHILQYQSVEYLLALEEKKSQWNWDLLEERKNTMQDMEYFQLRIMDANKQTDPLLIGKESVSYEQRLNYYTFEMQQDLFLVQGNDTTNCQQYHFVRSYGVAPYVDMMLAFTKKPESKADQRHFIFKNRLEGGKAINIPLLSSSIQNIPQITKN